MVGGRIGALYRRQAATTESDVSRAERDSQPQAARRGAQPATHRTPERFAPSKRQDAASTLKSTPARYAAAPSMSLPRIAITMGDPAGVGPEICLHLLANESIREVCVPIIFGDAHTLFR